MNQGVRTTWWAPVIGVVLAVGLMHPLWRAEWAVMDDHWVLSAIGPSGRLPWKAVPAAIATTEAWHPGAFSRYRPGTFVAQVIEAAVIGPRPAVWFMWRTAQFAFVIAALWWVASRFTGPLLATLVAVYTTTLYFWRDSFAHLFVSENWASLWLAVFALGAERLWRWKGSGEGAPTRALVVMAIAGTLAGATKENLLVLLPLQAAAVWWAGRRIHLRAVVWVSLLLFALSAAFVAGAVLIGLRRGDGMDMYGNSVAVRDRLALLVRPLPLALAAVWAATLAARRMVTRVGARLPDAERRAEWHDLWNSALVFLGVATLVLLSQFFFYNGNWPTRGARFDFPGRLVEIASYVGAWHFATRIMALWQWPAVHRRRVRLMFAVALVLLTLRHPLSLREAAEEQAALTHRVGAARRAIAAALKPAPDRPIVLLANSTEDDEPAASLARQLAVVERVPNPVYVDARRLSADPANRFAIGNLRRLQRFAENGGGGYSGRLRDPVLPWRALADARARGAPAPLCVAIRRYGPVDIVPCPAEAP